MSGRSTDLEAHRHLPDPDAMQAVLVGAPDPDIVALEARIRAAQLNADVEALSELIADDLLFTGPYGQLGTKSQDLEAHRTGVIRFRRHVPEQLDILRVGTDTAIVALRAQLAVEAMGALVEGTYRYTRVWSRAGDGTWRIVAGHVSAVQDGPAA
jgi:ketosteroid isomerase-like protein